MYCDLQLGALGVEQPLPGVLVRDDLLRVELPGRALVRHLEEQQVGQLLGVLDDADAVVAQHVAVGPELVDQAAGVSHGHPPQFARVNWARLGTAHPGQ